MELGNSQAAQRADAIPSHLTVPAWLVYCFRAADSAAHDVWGDKKHSRGTGWASEQL